MTNYSLQQKRSIASTLRQLLASLAIFSLVACSSDPLEDLNPFNPTTLSEINPFNSTTLNNLNPFKGEIETNQENVDLVRGFLGGVVVDEPRASLVGRDILSSGGTAADAAVAVALTLGVTKPSSASLGGGGVCLVYDNETNAVESIDFLPGNPERERTNTNSLSAIPGNIRGLAMLHSKYGRLKWSQLVSPAEKLARFGNPVSRAFATDLRRLPLAAWKDPEFRRIFGQGKGGALIKEGDIFRQLDLSITLGQIRVRGAGEFYSGLLGRKFSLSVKKVGGGFTLNDLRSYVPNWQPTLKVPFSINTTFHFPVTSGSSGVLAAQMTKILINFDNLQDLSFLEQSHLMAEISKITSLYRTNWLNDDGDLSNPAPRLISDDVIEHLASSLQTSHNKQVLKSEKSFFSPSPGTGTSFVVVDREGSAVSCGLTLNNLFGSGKVAAGTGVLLSAHSGLKRRGLNTLAGVLLINSLHKKFYFAASASGGLIAPSILVQVIADTLLKGEKGDLRQATFGKRVFQSSESELTFIEQGLTSNVVEGLANKGHQLRFEPSLGLVNSIFCSSGLPDKDGALCTQYSDPRGFGLSSGMK
mgnify:CR=1 FL=1